MSGESLKLTTYFGERDRAAGRFVADALLDVYAKQGIQSSLLLRGAGGFGLEHHLRSDRQLTLSEDLPLVSIAIDSRPRIEAALEEVMALKRRGLVTLERLRLIAGEIDGISLPEELHEATKVTVYLGRHERTGGLPSYMAVCELLHRRGIAGATALLGVDGTLGGERRRARFVGRNCDVPMMVIAIGAGSEIVRALPELSGLLREPLISLERVRVCKRDGELLARPHPLPQRDAQGRELWQKLMIYTSESALHRGRPIHAELLRRLRMTGATGATALRGIWGFHGDHRPHGDRLLQLRRRVPILTVTVGGPERTVDSFDLVDELTAETGLVTSEMVPAMTAISGNHRHGGLDLARHDF